MRSVMITCFFKCGFQNSILNAKIDINMIVDDLFTKNFKSVKFGSHVESERPNGPKWAVIKVEKFNK